MVINGAFIWSLNVTEDHWDKKNFNDWREECISTYYKNQNFKAGVLVWRKK